MFLLFFFFHLLTLGVSTGDHLPPSQSTPSILLCHASALHFFLDYNYESSLRASSFPPGCHLHIEHHLSKVLDMSNTCPKHLTLALLTIPRSEGQLRLRGPYTPGVGGSVQILILSIPTLILVSNQY